MQNTIEFGIGFITGRKNVCDIINTYYNDLVKQVKKNKPQVNITIFILYDVAYQGTKREDFYNLKPEVYRNIKIKYITPEDIEEEKKILTARYGFKKQDIELILGQGYAKTRNTIMYFALKRNINYLFFWDDDEYPIANIKQGKNTIWLKQNNIAEHLNYIKECDVTTGYRCGNMSPIPYVEYDESISEKDFKEYIDAVSNEAISWEKIKDRKKEDNGIAYANKKIIEQRKAHRIKSIGKENWLLASGICINLNHIEKIPAFYNPPSARGEDTFFSTFLDGCKVVQVPVYHFHDGFLQYTEIMKNNYPDKFDNTELEDQSIEQRFLNASKGWIKYKPLLIYITNRDEYRNIINMCREKLIHSIPKMNNVFKTCDFSCLLSELEQYDLKVEEHYKEYVKVNEVWNEIKERLYMEEGEKCIEL